MREAGFPWLLVLAGCASTGTFQTADVLDPGRWEAGADLSALVLTGGAGSPPVIAMPRARFRVGLVRRLDLGASVGLDGVRVQPKVQLTQGGGLIVSVAPAVKVLPLPSASGTGVLAGIEESVLFGLPVLDGRLQPVLALRGAQDVGRVNGNTAVFVWAGGNLGLSWQVFGPLRLMPEVGVLSPLWVRDGDEVSGSGGAAVFHAGFGVGIGRR